MSKLQLDLPAMYGDHHVLAVRHILLSTEGVTDVWASAAWYTIEVEYDPGKVSPEQIEQRLAGEGYTQPTPAPVLPSDDERARRFTVSLVEAGKQVSFGQQVPEARGRPLWPCPGMTPWREEEEGIDA